jgi:hypothetical protein
MIRGYESPHSTASPNPPPSHAVRDKTTSMSVCPFARRERGSGELMPRALAFSQRRARRCLGCAVLCYTVLCCAMQPSVLANFARTSGSVYSEDIVRGV